MEILLKVDYMRIPELLAPVGSMEHLKVAINAGASSVYLSGKDYGARKFAQNFTLDEINEAVNTAHLHNVKVYVTVNTLIKQDELEDVINYCGISLSLPNENSGLSGITKLPLSSVVG